MTGGQRILVVALVLLLVMYAVLIGANIWMGREFTLMEGLIPALALALLVFFSVKETREHNLPPVTLSNKQRIKISIGLIISLLLAFAIPIILRNVFAVDGNVASITGFAVALLVGLSVLLLVMYRALFPKG